MACSELSRRFALEIIRRCRVAPREDLTGIIEIHRKNRIHKDFVRFRSGRFGCTIHTKDKRIHLWAVTYGTKSLL
jgi:hypothetical protein